MKEKVIQIFDYLQALKNLRYPPIRDIRKYEKIWWQADFPQNGYLRLFDECHSPQAWIEVQNVKMPAHPKCPKELLEWIDESIDDPTKVPKYFKTLCFLTPKEKDELAKLPDIIETLEKELEILYKEVKSNNEVQINEKIANKEQDIKIAEKRWEGLEIRNNIQFISDEKRLEIWNEFIKKWYEWQPEALLKYKIQKIYGELFSLYQKFQREGDSIELVFGHGLLTWFKNDENIVHPFLITRLELDFDYKNATFIMKPTDIGTELELNFIMDMNLPNINDLLLAKKSFQDYEQIPYDSTIIKPFLKDITNIIDPNGRIEYDNIFSLDAINIDKYPIIYNAPLLYVRARATNLWQNEFQQIKEMIKQNDDVPDPIKSLTTDDVFSDSEENSKWEMISEEILFPLPSNDEQREIIRKLSGNCGVAVQGPPGTGKSHTIVNIIAHLLAYGRKILVTSETSRALRVLGEMIDKNLPEISPLCVSLLDNTEKAHIELENSVKGIYQGLTYNRTDVLEKEIKSFQEQITKCDNEYVILTNKLKDLLIKETSEYNENNIADIANKLKIEENEYSWLPDSISYDSSAIFNGDEIRDLFHLAGIIKKNEIEQINKIKPCLNELAPLNKIESIFKKLRELLQQCSARQKTLSNWNINKIESDSIQQAIKIIEKAIISLQEFESNWNYQILEEVSTDSESAKIWNELYDYFIENIKKIKKADRFLSKYNFTIPKNIKLKSDIDNIKIIISEFYRNNGKLGKIFKITQKKIIQSIQNNYKIDGEIPIIRRDYENLHEYLINLRLKIEIINKWNNNIKKFEGPVLPAFDLHSIYKLEKYLFNIKFALDWNIKFRPQTRQFIFATHDFI